MIAGNFTTPDERPGDYLETRPSNGFRAPAARYPAPTKADLVTMWRRGSDTVMSVSAGGQVVDYELPLHIVASLGREAVDALHRAGR